MNKSSKKITRILALIGAIILVGLVVLTLVASLSNWEQKDNIFLVTIGSTIVIPTLIYAVLLFTKKNDNDNTDKTDKST